MKEICLEATLPIFTWRACELFYEDAAFEKRHLQGMNPPRSGALGDFPELMAPLNFSLGAIFAEVLFIYFIACVQHFCICQS
jgi:hypothetical protein